MSIRIDKEKLRGILVGHSGRGQDKPSFSGLLYQSPPLPSDKHAAPSVPDFLVAFPAFQGLTRKEAAVLASVVHQRSFGDGEIVYEQGSFSAALYLIRTGCVELFRKSDGSEAVLVALGPNEFLGELAVLVDEAPRQTSARSRGASELLALSRQDFETLMERSPLVSLKIYRALARVVALRFKMVMEALEGHSET